MVEVDAEPFMVGSTNDFRDLLFEALSLELLSLELLSLVSGRLDWVMLPVPSVVIRPGSLLVIARVEDRLAKDIRAV